MPADTDPQPEPEIRTVSFVSLGCPKNLVDSERMLGSLAQDGLIPVSYHPTDDERWDDAGHTENTSFTEGDSVAVDEGVDPADAVVINTCGFLEASKEESMAVIRDAVRAKQAGRVKRVVVAGCLVQRHKAKMLDWEPGIDAMIGVFDRDHIIEAVRGVRPERDHLSPDESPKYWVASNALVAARDRGLQTTGLTVNGKDGKGVGYFEDDSARLRLTPRHYAYLRMSEGCNQACAFCTIPSIRGKMRSKPIDRVVAEAKELITDGVFELNLIGQDTTSYGDDIGLGWKETPAPDLFSNGGLPQLLKSVSDAVRETGGQGWVRLMYAYPSNFRDEFIDAFAALCEQGHLLPYIDIPLQHASQRMLEQMRRHVSADQQADLMRTLRDRIPGLAIRTTFISGFPGETEQDHEQLLEFIEEVGFDALGVFEYSAEPGTPAGTMEQDPALAVPPEVKARRKGEIMALQQRIAFEQARYIADQWDEADPLGSGVQLDILIDRVAGDSLFQGRAYHQAPQIDSVTYVQTSQQLAPGELVRCAIVDADGYDLIARPLADLDPTVRLNILR
ncbi:MAG TPA: 30S ribosomal protein S12 methylthiotransferase RimO [Phycisphaerales bacterium]|nr:30S ribosomal protein S12 methylthiotransferase RimO [Phycisphaerales bacterium]